MSTLPEMEDEKSILRWGGLAGILGGVLLIIVFGIVAVFVGPDPVEIEGWVTRFPGIRAARTVENSLYLLVLLLWAVHSLALYEALRRSRPAPALFGTGLGIVGLTVMAAGALPHVATVPLSDLYHAPGASPETQATLALLWRATWGIFEALLGAGLFAVTIGVLALGAAMVGAAGFGRRTGWVSIGLGGIGIAATLVFFIDPPSPVAALAVFALIIFHLVVGWKLFKLGRAGQEPQRRE